MKYIKYILGMGVVLGMIFIAAESMLFGDAATAVASVSFTTPTQTPYTFKNFTFFTATTTNATSTNTLDGGGYLVITGVKKVTYYFTHGGTATTSTTGATFKVQMTRNGTDWTDFNKLVDSDKSSTATSTYAIQGATSTAAVSANLVNDTYYATRCISAEFANALATDGESTCAASAEF